MTTRHPLLADWRRRLTQHKQRLEGNGRTVWLDEIRARILKYLISRYGYQTLSDDELDEFHAGRAKRTTSTAVATSVQRGAPPRSREAIRALLQSIHDVVHPVSRHKPD